MLIVKQSNLAAVILESTVIPLLKNLEKRDPAHREQKSVTFLS